MDQDDEVQHIGEHSILKQIDSLTLEQRVSARQEYTGLIADVNAALEEEDVGRIDINFINASISAARRVFKSGRVLLPTEGVYDVEAIRNCSELIKRKIVSEVDEETQFHCAEYAERLHSMIDSLSIDHRVADEDQNQLCKWGAFGETVVPFLREAPAFHYLYGAFKKEEKEIPQPKKRENNVAKRKNDLSQLTQPKRLTGVDQTGDCEKTTRMVEKMHKILKTAIKKNNNSPVSCFELILHPKSFSKTVENIFFLSFLIRDDKAKIAVDQYGLPVLSLNEKPSSQGKANGSLTQAVFKLEYHEWKDLIKVYGIKEPMLDFDRPLKNIQ